MLALLLQPHIAVASTHMHVQRYNRLTNEASSSSCSGIVLPSTLATSDAAPRGARLSRRCGAEGSNRCDCFALIALRSVTQARQAGSDR